MKIKHFIMLFAAVLSFSACADIPPVKEPVPVEQQNVVPVPEDGWTVRELMSVTYFDDIELCYPLSVRDLGSGYKLDYIEAFSKDQGKRIYFLDHAVNFKDAEVTLEHNDAKISPDDEIRSLSASVFQDKIFMSVNGLNHTSSEADVQNALGTPDRTDEDTFRGRIEYYYCDKETGKDLLCVYIDKEYDKVWEFELFLQ